MRTFLHSRAVNYVCNNYYIKLGALLATVTYYLLFSQPVSIRFFTTLHVGIRHMFLLHAQLLYILLNQH